MNSLTKLRIIITTSFILMVSFVILWTYAQLNMNTPNSDVLQNISSNDLEIYIRVLEQVQSSLLFYGGLFLLGIIMLSSVILILFILMIKLWIIKKL